MNLKINIKTMIRCIVFCCLLIVSFSYVERICRDKSVEAVSKEYVKYGNDKFDVVFFGSSVMKNGVYPMQLYNEFGMASYNLGSGNQSLASSYYLIKETIRKQSPDLIVLDCLYAAFTEDYLGDEFLHYVTDIMDGPEKIQLIWETLPVGKWEDFLFPFTRYHSRWSELTENDFLHTEHSTYGAKVHYASKPIADFKVTRDTMPLPETAKKYLMKIIELCREEDVELLLVTMPVDFGMGKCVFGDMTECQKYYNEVQEIANEQNIHYLNFMHLYTDAALDFSVDFDGWLHLNAYGATKMTTYLGEFIKNNYDIPDVRGDSDYAFMEEDYEEYIRYFYEQKLCNERNLNEYLEALSEMNDYSIILSVKDIQGYYLTPEVIEKMKKIGFLKADILIEREYHGYIGVLSNGKCIHENVSNEHASLSYTGELLNMPVSIVSETLNGGNRSSILIDNVEYSLNRRGFNIVVICNETGEIIDKVCFDTHVPEFTCYR